MKPAVPLREKWLRELLTWPAARQTEFNARLEQRRASFPVESSGWAFIATFRAYRQERIDTGDLTFSEAWPDATGTARTSSELALITSDPVEYERRMARLRHILHHKPLAKPTSPAQLRLLTAPAGPARWDSNRPDGDP